MGIVDAKDKKEYLGRLISFDEQDGRAFFEFDLGFQKWHTQEVKVKWSMSPLVRDQFYTVYLAQEKEVDPTTREKTYNYEATVFNRTD